MDVSIIFEKKKNSCLASKLTDDDPSFLIFSCQNGARWWGVRIPDNKKLSRTGELILIEFCPEQVLTLDRGGENWYGHKIVSSTRRNGQSDLATVPFFAKESE